MSKPEIEELAEALESEDPPVHCFYTVFYTAAQVLRALAEENERLRVRQDWIRDNCELFAVFHDTHIEAEWLPVWHDEGFDFVRYIDALMAGATENEARFEAIDAEKEKG